MVFAIFSALRDVNLQCGDRTSHFAWHLQGHLQHLEHDICSFLKLQPSILHVYAVLWNLQGRCIVRVQPSNLEWDSVEF